MLPLADLVKATLICPRTVDIVMDPDVRLPGCGFTRTAANPGNVGWTPKRCQGMTYAGLAAQGWLKS